MLSIKKIKIKNNINFPPSLVLKSHIRRINNIRRQINISSLIDDRMIHKYLKIFLQIYKVKDIVVNKNEIIMIKKGYKKTLLISMIYRKITK